VKFKIGHNYFDARSGKTTSIVWDSERLINGHVLIVGSSGVGKSHTIRKMIRRALVTADGRKGSFGGSTPIGTKAGSRSGSLPTSRGRTRR